MTQSDDLTARKAGLSETRRALLEKRLGGKTVAPDRQIPRRDKDAPLPLSFGQQRLWFISKLNPESSAYNMHTSLRIQGPLDPGRLEWAVNAIVARHEILRTSFRLEDGRPVQHIAPALRIPLTMLDLQEEADPLQAAVAVCQRTARLPFDLDEAPLLRAQVLKLDDADHVFHVSIHHILFDEWSNRLFWDELGALYEHGTIGAAELPIQYADYAVWQRSMVEDGAVEDQRAYWHRQLEGELPKLQLPLDHARQTIASGRGALKTIQISEQTLAGLHAVSQRSGTTMFTTLLAACNLFLFHLSRQEDILVGTPVANRDRLETERSIGFFLNTLVIRTNLSGSPTFTELLSRVREKTLGALANAEMPFEMIVRELHPEREPGQNPLFQVMFVYQKGWESTYRLPGLQVQELEIDAQNAKFDLTLFIGETEKNLTATLEYNTDLFEDSTIERWLAYLNTLLASIVEDPDRSIHKLSLLDADARRVMLEDWNDTAAAFPAGTRVHDWIEKHALSQPEHPALRFDGREVTYEALNTRANRLAHRLLRLGIVPDQPVAIFMERSFEMITALLAILKAGGAYVPLDPTYPWDRLAFLLEDSGARVVLAQSHLADRLPTTEAAVLLLDAPEDSLDDEPGADPKPDGSAENLAYVMYTSGSTGRPKGVKITHQNLAHSTAARFDYYPDQPGRFLLLSSFSFDSSVVGIYWSLCGGGTLVLPAQGEEQSVSELVELVRTERVTHLLCLPSLWKLMLEYADPGSLRSLSTVIVAGEACPADLPPLHYSLLPKTALYNEYGPTEGTVWSTACRLTPELKGGIVPIGRPIPNMRVYILDEHQEPLPVGVAGEIYIAGRGVAEGYWNRPDLTNERFFRDPFTVQSDKRMYTTGDLGRFAPDGTIEFLGRVDNQIKIRGHRVELDEIAAALQGHPEVRDAVVIAAPENEAMEYVSQERGNGQIAEALAGLQPDEAEKLLVEIERLSADEVQALLDGKD